MVPLYLSDFPGCMTTAVTVILCTYNRSEILLNALESLVVQVMPESTKWEIVVIDNNSSDRTREVIEAVSRANPGRIRYIFEPQQGKSHALNTGIREAQGDILAFVDDDVTVEPTWLANLTKPLHDGDAVGAGGRILPDRGFRPPDWLNLEVRHALAPFALFDLGPGAGPLNQSPFGTNMAFRKEMFKKYGQFRIDLGPCPGSEIRDEDTEFGGRLIAAGERLRYEPSAIVYHPVSEKRVEKKYFLDWYFDKGRAEVRQFGTPRDALCCCGVPLYLFRRLGRWTLKWLTERRVAQRFWCRTKVWGIAGQIVEYRRRFLAKAKPV